jgi:hypothetical protein
VVDHNVVRCDDVDNHHQMREVTRDVRTNSMVVAFGAWHTT